MKTFKVTAHFEHTATFTVNAIDEDSARAIVREQQFNLNFEDGDFGSLLGIDNVIESKYLN